MVHLLNELSLYLFTLVILNNGQSYLSTNPLRITHGDGSFNTRDHCSSRSGTHITFFNPRASFSPFPLYLLFLAAFSSVIWSLQFLLLTSPRHQVSHGDMIFKGINPIKIKHYVWLVLQNIVLVRDCLWHMSLVYLESSICPMWWLRRISPSLILLSLTVLGNLNLLLPPMGFVFHRFLVLHNLLYQLVSPLLAKGDKEVWFTIFYEIIWVI